MFHVSEAALDWALEHIQKLGDSAIFPTPFEYEAIAFDWAAIKPLLANADLDTWATRPHRICLTPKSRFSYRVSTQLDPLDSLLYLALIYESGVRLEQLRVPTDENVVFSYRFKPDAHFLYDRLYHWGRFIAQCRVRSRAEGITHVVVADISGFFFRLYHHRIENMLAVAMPASGESRAIFKLIDQWAGPPSYGIPVGPIASRLVAEATIDDIDRSLLADHMSFCRSSDDFRIFCTSEQEAYEHLATLAWSLFQNQGLTLQPDKTRIIPVQEFRTEYLVDPEAEELDKLQEKFEEYAHEFLDNPYEDVDFEDLDPEVQEEISALNLEDLAREYFAQDELDVPLLRFLLRRLGQLNDWDIAEEIIGYLEGAYQLVPEIMQYLGSLRGGDHALQGRLGSQILDLVEDSIIAHLPFNRYWLLTLFSASSEWNHADKFVELFDASSDGFTRRELTLALGRSGQAFVPARARQPAEHGSLAA